LYEEWAFSWHQPASIANASLSDYVAEWVK
jgi:hypothetical protein